MFAAGETRLCPISDALAGSLARSRETRKLISATNDRGAERNHRLRLLDKIGKKLNDARALRYLPISYLSSVPAVCLSPRRPAFLCYVWNLAYGEYVSFYTRLPHRFSQFRGGETSDRVDIKITAGTVESIPIYYLAEVNC